MKFKPYIAVGLLVATVICFAQLKISQYPNTAAPEGTDLFILASGTTNKNIQWSQLLDLVANVTNSTITNLNVWEGYMSNLYVTNLYVDNFDAPTVTAGDTYVTNLYVTNGYASNFYSTNITVYNNQFVSNSYITNLSVKNMTVETNVYYLEGANNVYTVATNNTTTNVVVNFTNAVQTIRFTNSITLFSTTNRPAGVTNLAMTLLMFYNSSGGNLTINTNNTLGWKISGVSFPLTVTNGDFQTLTIMGWGPYETNVSIGANVFH